MTTPHPDDMTQLDHFKVLLEEQPDQAALVLQQGAAAIDLLTQVEAKLRGAVTEINQSHFQRPVGPLGNKDGLASVAMRYGMIWERFGVISNAVNDIGMPIQQFLAMVEGRCPFCLQLHDYNDHDG